MADWTDIPDDNLAPNAPARSADMIAMRDNTTAQAEGATGAPKTQTAAIDDDAVTSDKLAETTNERDWVNGRTAASSVGAVGTYAMLVLVSGSIRNPGQTVSGSSLRYSNANGQTGSTPSGTWRCMGLTTAVGTTATATTLWLRIS